MEGGAALAGLGKYPEFYAIALVSGGQSYSQTLFSSLKSFSNSKHTHTHTHTHILTYTQLIVILYHTLVSAYMHDIIIWHAIVK